MKHSFVWGRNIVATMALSLAVVASTHAALKPGDAAPSFSTTQALAGKTAPFDLQSALAKGPVVLYFFPKAFTQGCTLEAHAFAEATPDFNKMGATVFGISHDDVDTLKKFSTEACRDQFAVLSDSEGKTIRAYDALMASNPKMSGRISYVIDKSGKIVFAHEGSDPLEHVKQTMDAVKKLSSTNR